MMPELISHKSKWIKTKENWYPSYAPHKYGNPLDTEALKVHLTLYTGHQAFVSVWGADDFGLETNGYVDDRLAEQIYDSIVDYSTEADIRKLGLINA